jgi:hypothetical protein
MYLVSDFFIDEVSGGAEINDDILFQELSKKINIKKVKSQNFSINIARTNSLFIISNFALLNPQIIEYLVKNKKKYIIYEHDHKYLIGRNPGIYKSFTAPPEDIVNKLFYENSLAILSQSNFHKNIIQKNLNINNVINLGGNLWNDDILEYMKILSKKEKKDICSIMFSEIPHKNTLDAIKYCEVKNIKYELISDNDYKKFLEKISNNNTLIFLLKTPETLSRICVEARMCNMKVITNNMVGATQEEWFFLKGEELINFMRKKKEEIINLIVDKYNENFY